MHAAFYLAIISLFIQLLTDVLWEPHTPWSARNDDWKITLLSCSVALQVSSNNSLSNPTTVVHPSHVQPPPGAGSPERISDESNQMAVAAVAIYSNVYIHVHLHQFKYSFDPHIQKHGTPTPCVSFMQAVCCILVGFTFSYTDLYKHLMNKTQAQREDKEAGRRSSGGGKATTVQLGAGRGLTPPPDIFATTLRQQTLTALYAIGCALTFFKFW